MTDDEHHGDGAEQSAPASGGDGQGDGAYDDGGSQCAGRERRHICAVGQKHTRPDDDDGVAGGGCYGGTCQPGGEADEPGDGGLEQAGEFAEQFAGETGGGAGDGADGGDQAQEQDDEALRQ